MNTKSGPARRALVSGLVAILLPAAFAAGQELPLDLAQTVAAAYEAGDASTFELAARALETAAAADPENVEIRKKLGYLYLENLRDPAKALPHLEKVNSAIPSDEGWIQLLARAYEEGRRFDRAAALYEQSATRAPGDLWPRYHLGWVLLKAGRKAEARAAFERARAIDPTNRYVIEALGAAAAPTPKQRTPLEQAVGAAYASGDVAQFRRAAAMLEAELRRTPGDLPNRKSLAYLYLEKLHDFPAALPHLQAVIDALPHDTGWLEMLAKAQEEAGKVREASISWRNSVVRNPHDVWARYHLGQMLVKLGRPADAREVFSEAQALDPHNQYVRIELARLANTGGHFRDASALTREILRAEPRNADAHTLLGDIYRTDWDFSRAASEYRSALDANPSFNAARIGLNEIRKLREPRAFIAFYDFNDTQEFRQAGVFATLGLLLIGPLRATVSSDERWFKQTPNRSIDRFDNGLTLEYRPNRWLDLAAGIGQFKTENRGSKPGGNAALYVTPARALDLWAGYRFHDPVSDNFLPAREAFTQNVVAGGATLRASRLATASFIASSADYSDGNTRRDALGTLSYLASAKYSTTAKLGYEWLDFARRDPGYSSPQNYGLLRPAIEATPRIADWLKLQFLGEFIYVVDEKAWGTGLSVGPRFLLSDHLEFGFQYLRYDIPGYQTNYSGQGFKMDLSCTF